MISARIGRLANQRDRQAFTLIELLVVVAIIVVLIALLLPALAKAKDQARTEVCASQFRQHGLAFQMYANEWNNWILSSVQCDTNPNNSPAGSPSGGAWRILMINEMANGPASSVLAPGYLWDGTNGQPGWSQGTTVTKARNYKIFLCPQSVISLDTAASPYGPPWDSMLSTRNIDGELLTGLHETGSPSSTPVTYHSRRFSDMTKSISMEVMEGDKNQAGGFNTVVPGPDATHPVFRHWNRTAANFLEADGHVDTLTGYYNATTGTATGTAYALRANYFCNFTGSNTAGDGF